MELTNGIVSNLKSNIFFKTEWIPLSNEKARPAYRMEPEFITIHNTGDAGASALALSNYVRNQNGYKSWHFTVGNGIVIQHLPINESAWHAGDGEHGTGNRKSIGIEICEVDNAEETAIIFIAELLKALNMDIGQVTTHQHWSGKNCPRLILPHWSMFISNIEKELLKTNPMTLQEAEKIVQDKTGIDNNTMQYLRFYKYSDDLILKFAKAMK